MDDDEGEEEEEEQEKEEEEDVWKRRNYKEANVRKCQRGDARQTTVVAQQQR